MVTATIGGSALFAARFRECAARALLPRRNPAGGSQPGSSGSGRPSPRVASKYPSFPIVLEAVRECVQDVYDRQPALVDLMRAVERRGSRSPWSPLRPLTPSPALLFGYVAQFLYEGRRAPGGRRAAALAMDRPCSRTCWAGRRVGPARPADPDSLARTEAEYGISPRAGGAATPRMSPTCSGCSGHSRDRGGGPQRQGPADAEPDLRQAVGMGSFDEIHRSTSGHRRPYRRRGAVCRRGGRRPATGTPWARPSRRACHAFLDGGPDPSVTSSSLCPHPWPVHRGRGGLVVGPGTRGCGGADPPGWWPTVVSSPARCAR